MHVIVCFRSLEAKILMIGHGHLVVESSLRKVLALPHSALLFGVKVILNVLEKKSAQCSCDKGQLIF